MKDRVKFRKNCCGYAKPHMCPVIWATQVLESLVKSGIPTRSEISDVVAGSRAECIMLNKGDYIVSGVNAVDDILKKFENHHHKKTSMLRALNIAEQQFQ